MGKKVFFIVSVIFSLIITAVYLSPPFVLGGDSFWYAEDMTEYLSEDAVAELQDLLVNTTLPMLEEEMAKFDNRNEERGVTIYNKQEAWNGYTLLGSLSGDVGEDGTVYRTVLIDMEGKVVNRWTVFPFPAKMLPNGNVIGQDGGSESAFQFCKGLPLQELDWFGNEVWRNDGVGGFGQHHDFQRKGTDVYYTPHNKKPILNGTMLFTGYSYPSTHFDTSNVSEYHMLQESPVYEVDSDGNVWAWFPWEHIDQLGFTAKGREGIQNTRVGRPCFEDGSAMTTDWIHINTTAYVGPNKWYKGNSDSRFHSDNIIIVSRQASFVAIIARHDDKKGSFKEGDVVWRLGPNFSQANPEHKIGKIIGPHGAHLIPKGLPGAGNMLLFDNGGNAGYGSLLPGMPGTCPSDFRDYSRVIEFNPITYEIVWEYKNLQTVEHLDYTERKFWSPLISNAQRLMNGNTLIVEGNTGRVFEVTRSGKIVWEYISEFEGDFGLPLPFIKSTALYRAYRVPSDWVPK